MTVSQIFTAFAIAATLFVAAVVLCRDVRSFAHRSLALCLTLTALEAAAIGFAPTIGPPGKIIFWQWVRFLITSLIPGVWVVFSLSFARSNYREILWRQIWFVIAAFALPIAFAVAFRNQFFVLERVPSDAGTLLVRFGWSGYLFHLTFLLSCVYILVNLERTLRTSAGRVRWKIKFVILGVGSFFAMRIYFSSQALLYRSLEPVILIFIAAVLFVLNLCILAALKRSHDLDMDFYVSTTFAYNSVTVFLVGLYLVSVALVAHLSLYLGITRGNAFVYLWVFLAFLGIAAFLLSDKLRRRLKRFIARHLKRPYYDYRKEWASFTESTTKVTDIVDLCNVVVRKVSKTIDALSVTIWLTDETGESIVMAGSTVFAEGKFQELAKLEKVMLEMLRHAGKEGSLVGYDYRENGWAKEGTVPERFVEETRIQHAIPLVAAGKVLGLMTLGDRVGGDGNPLTPEDFDLLKTMADQAAANLYSLMLGERLRKAKEVEAFRAMSAFFLHDLKNVASKISLTMQNLPIHFENPEFRADALKSFSQSLAKINRMCTGLTALSQRLEVNKEKADLNRIVSTVVDEMKTAMGTDIVFEPGRLPMAGVDPEQFQKVVVNLLLNARDATADGGVIRVETRENDGWLECSVKDQGCGMSRDFIENFLFRPFQTTKKQGMGIGLYHSKSIIEAHNGRIEVESEEGKGTTFRVLIPA